MKVVKIGTLVLICIRSRFRMYIIYILDIKDIHSFIHHSGARVGVLKYRDSDAAHVVHEGGTLVETDGWNFYSDVLSLMKKLRNGDVDGLLLDKYTLMYTKEYLRWKRYNVDNLATPLGTDGEVYEERR